VNAAGRMQIGEVAERIGLSLRTIRYYEEVGLAVPSARSEGGFRLYVEDDVERLPVVMQIKPLRFSLEEMRELLDLLDAGHGADPARLR
jgi:DNA-binding transcriptional MerR regulator